MLRLALRRVQLRLLLLGNVPTTHNRAGLSSWLGPSSCLIHPSAWKGASPKFARAALYGVRVEQTTPKIRNMGAVLCPARWHHAHTVRAKGRRNTNVSEQQNRDALERYVEAFE